MTEEKAIEYFAFQAEKDNEVGTKVSSVSMNFSWLVKRINNEVQYEILV